MTKAEVEALIAPSDVRLCAAECEMLGQYYAAAMLERCAAEIDAVRRAWDEEIAQGKAQAQRIAELERLTEPGQIDWAARCGRAEAALRQAVPREPTEAMIDAGYGSKTGDSRDPVIVGARGWVAVQWRAMYDAAPAAAPGEKT